jgi:hypothetical protein
MLSDSMEFDRNDIVNIVFGCVQFCNILLNLLLKRIVCVASLLEEYFSIFLVFIGKVEKSLCKGFGWILQVKGNFESQHRC